MFPLVYVLIAAGGAAAGYGAAKLIENEVEAKPKPLAVRPPPKSPFQQVKAGVKQAAAAADETLSEVEQLVRVKGATGYDTEDLPDGYGHGRIYLGRIG
jgi:hypothetical protein